MALCYRFGARFHKSQFDLKVGISRNIKESVKPLNGLRQPVTNDMTGWYIWAGDYSDADDFFVPMQARHLLEFCPQVLKYLGLAPGWRFLISGEYEDVWEDRLLLEI